MMQIASMNPTPSGGLVDDITASVEARAARIAQTAASTAVRDALPAIQQTISQPNFALNLGRGAVEAAFAPTHRAELDRMATMAGQAAARSYSTTAIVGAFVVGALTGHLLSRWSAKS